MKVGVISDTHISGQSGHIPEQILNAFKQVDMVIHAGDMIDLRVIDELKSVCAKVLAVAGNMDHQEVRDKYPSKELFEVAGLKIGVMHGWGSEFNLLSVLKTAFKADNPDIIIFGHSHKAMNEQIGATLFFNPGSATDATAEYNSYGIITIKDKLKNNACLPARQGLVSDCQSQKLENNGIDARIIKI